MPVAPPGAVSARQVAAIPLDGTDEDPLRWRLDADAEQSSAQAVLAARRYLAIDHLLFVDTDDAGSATLLGGVATGQARDLTYGSARDGKDAHGHGPRRYWVMRADGDPAGPVGLTVCADRHRLRYDGPTPTAQPVAMVDLMTVQVVKGDDGRWRVARVAARPVRDAAQAPGSVAGVARRCQGWALGG